MTMVLDVEADAFVTFVATLPRHRGQGLAGALGYRPLGEQHLWELRP